MRRQICLVLTGMSCLSLAWAAPAAPSVPAFKSESVQFPENDKPFTGRNSDAMNGNCLGCHSADMVLDQPLLPEAVWAAEVKKMITVYKAPVPPADVTAIVAYLVAVRGKP